MATEKKRVQTLTDRKVDSVLMERLNKIHKLIKEGNFPTITQISKLTGKGQVTVYRDLAILKAKRSEGGFEAPLKKDHNGRYFYTDSNYELIVDSTSPEKLLAFATAKNVLSGFSDTSFYKEISEITDKMSGGSMLMERIAVAKHPQAVINNRDWDKIATAISENRKLNIKLYCEVTDPPSIVDIIFCPYQLIFSEDKYYLYGKAEIIIPKDKFVRFNDFNEYFFLYGDKTPKKIWEREIVLDFSQFNEVTLSNKNFIFPENIDLAKVNITPSVGYLHPYFDKGFKERMKAEDEKTGENTYKVILEQEKEHKLYDATTTGKVKLKLNKKARELVKTYTFAKDQIIEENEKDHSVNITFTPDFPNVLKWVLSYSPNIEPLEPPELVIAWKRVIMELFENHISEEDKERQRKEHEQADSIKI